MSKRRGSIIGVAILLTVALVGGVLVLSGGLTDSRTHIVAYFDNTNGLFKGDEIRILGVPVGAVDRIEPQPNRVKVQFWVDNKYKVPAEAKAAILSPQLITSRAIQLTPAYTGGAAMANGAVIPQNRTAVPVEWDDLRQQLEKLTDALQPTTPGGVSSLGAFINTTADNLRGQGANIHDTILKVSKAFSILGDHSDDIFGTVKNLSQVVSALHDSSALLANLNRNLSAVTALLAEDPGAVGKAVNDISAVVGDTQSFIADNREALGTSTDKLASISRAVYDSLDDIKQTLHVAPNAYQNLLNIYQPTQAALTAALVVNNFSNPITFICGAIQAASRLNSAQSAKLCVQYLAPIFKNRQWNFPPLGENLFVGESARPNEITYSEDWMRPDYVAPQLNAAAPPAPTAVDAGSAPAGLAPPLPGVDPRTATDPAAGLPGMMMPQGGGS